MALLTLTRAYVSSVMSILAPCPSSQDELETLAMKAAAYSRAEKRQGELQKEVRALQEALADTNMVIDKV
jgi:peptidoglycan hydrolase CwlO-like protein